MLTWPAAGTAIRRAAAAAALAASLLAAGCSHAASIASGPGAAGVSSAPAGAAPARTSGSVTEDSAAFCSFLASMNKIATQAATRQQGIKLLASIMPRLKAQRATAPAAVAADFGVVVTAAEQASARGDLSPLATNQVATAGTRLANYCHTRS